MAAMDVDDGAVPMDVDGEKAAPGPFTEALEKALDLETSNPDGAIKAYKDIAFTDDEDEAAVKQREEAFYSLVKFMAAQKKADDLVALNKDMRPVFANLPKAKTAKMVRTLIEAVGKIEGKTQDQIDMCKECVEWCKLEKRTFLRHRIETRLGALLLEHKDYKEALDVLASVLKEVKKLDDKLLLVEIHLIECQVHYSLENIPKAKAALTASKTNANAIHCPPLMQASIDLWSGVICAREKDYATSFSYFYEAFEAFTQLEDPRAKNAMKYMMLSKIMNSTPQACSHIVSSKNGLKNTGTDIDALVAVADAHKERSLKKFEALLDKYKKELREEKIIAWHLSDLNETLLEQNILRILEPFSRVELSHVAELMELPFNRTLQKLSEMILDEKLNGTLDQGIGVLILFDSENISTSYDNCLKTIKNSSTVIDTLYSKAKQLF